jgi:Immunoglobulin domain
MKQKITISDMNECIIRRQVCNEIDYAIMKDNLLLYHHQNIGFLQHGPEGQVHRMDYLVSIIFSHYDQNNDGLVERDELLLMWNTMDMQRVANDSNCTLMDMLTYDDTNEDHVLTINEFNDAFHRISESKLSENSIDSVTHEQVLPKIHLDISLVLNHLSVHVGDNMEIQCDITGSSASNIIWKRFGFDLSHMRNSSDDYEDDDGSDMNEEVRLMNDGGIYIQNVQMKHAGNYTCQASTNGLVVQTHVVTVHGEKIRKNFIKIFVLIHFRFSSTCHSYITSNAIKTSWRTCRNHLLLYGRVRPCDRLVEERKSTQRERRRQVHNPRERNLVENQPSHVL